MWSMQDNKFGRQHVFLYLHALRYNKNNKETSRSLLHNAYAESSSPILTTQKYRLIMNCMRQHAEKQTM